MMKHSEENYRLFFSSLANPSRLKIVHALRGISKDVSHICQETGLEQTQVSHNLKRLEKCGMVFAKKMGKHRYYTLNKETITPLLELIDMHFKEIKV
jgi:DNA-binding transcriptional ArsR family regulator